MIWLSLFVLTIRLALIRQDLGLNQFSTSLHNQCVQWAHNYQVHSVITGLVCAEDLSSDAKSLFLGMGIYHWFVASGSHLLLLQSILSSLQLRGKIVVTTILFFYSFVCGFQPPMVRSLLSLLISFASQGFSLFLTPSQTVLIAGSLCLAIFPSWTESLSLQLSWLAALAMTQAQKEATKTCAVSLLLWPLFEKVSLLHLFYNITLTPFFSRYLFPLSFVFFILSPFTHLGTNFWDKLLQLLAQLPAELVSLDNNRSPLSIWSYLFSLHLFIHLRERILKCRF